MPKFKEPMHEGPLNNPDWTDEENRAYDTLDHGEGLPSGFIRHDIGVNSTQPKAVDDLVVPSARTSRARPSSRNSRRDQGGMHPTEERRRREDLLGI